MATLVRRYENSSVSDNARAHFGDSYTGDHQAYSHELSNNRGNININYAADVDVTSAERNRRLLEAAAEKQTPRVVALLKLKANVEFCDEQGLTALHHAVLSGHGDVVHVLLEQGADINARATKMGSPLCLAALNGDLRMVQILLGARAKVELSDGPFGTALHCACYDGNLAIARALVQKGALIDSKCPLDFEQLRRYCCPSRSGASTTSGETASTLTETWSPLFLVVWWGFSDVLQLLLAAGCQVNSPCGVDDLTSLMVAAKCGNVTAGRMLLQNSANVNAHDRWQRTVLHHASEGGQEAFVKLLLGGRAQLEALDNASRTPILVAAASSRPAIVRLLASNGADLALADSGGNTLLRFAMQKENSEIAQILADEAAKRRGSWRSRLFLSTFDATAKEVFECIVSASEANSPQRMDPIQIAAKRSLANAIPVLHSLGAHATHTDGQAWTAAHHAAQSGSLDAFRFVLELGAVLDAPTNQRETALAIASRAGHSEIVLDALQRGADPDVRNSLGLTPLHLAAGSGHVKTAEVLISNTVNPSAKSIAGDSALHYASRGGHSLLFPVLLGRGLDLNLPNSAGRTALDDALDEKTRAALLACYQSRLLPAQATQAPAVRVAPVPPPVTALAMKPQNSAPAPIVHEKSKPNLAESLASLFAYIVLFIVFLVALPAVLVACVQILGTIAAIGTFWAVMPTPSTVDGGSLLGTLLAVFEGFWKMLIIFCSLALAMGIGKASNAPGIATIGMLCAFPWLGLHWWAAATGSMALGHAYLISGLICGSIYLALGALIRRQEVARIRATAKT
jgi:ankyrin repeat protein